MKVFFIAAHESDYLQDSVFAGLCEILGQENVFDFPLKLKKYYGAKAYPRNLGYQKDFSWLTLIKQRMHFDFLKSSDLVIVASTKPETFRLYQSVQKEIPSSTPVVFLDGGDRPELGGDLERLKAGELYQQVQSIRPFDFIFKREYLTDSTHPPNVIPLPFAINPALLYFSEQERPQELIYDVTFWAVESDPIRTKALALIEDLWDCRNNGTERNQTFKKYSRKGRDYLRALLEAKITLNFRGVGWDTLRYWEVTGLGRFLISQKPQIVIPDNFREGKEIVFCKDDLSDLVEIADYYLKNEKAREEIARAARDWSLKYHTHRNRAETILKKVSSSGLTF